MTAADAAKTRVDLDAYCARVGYEGPRTATIETLRALHELHPAAIAFEAIDALLDRRISLAPAAVDHKLIAAGRGGYCYEHNSLFKRVLMALGFAVDGLAARVCWGLPTDAPPRPRTHMALRVTIDNQPWLADVGFGGTGPTAPLRLDQTDAQATRHQTYRLRPLCNERVLEAWLGDNWAPLYELSREPQLDVDYEVPNWYTSTHPDSGFRQQLMVACTTLEARYSLDRNRLTIRRPDGTVTHQLLSADEIEHHLAATFGLPVAPEWRPIIERAAASDSVHQAGPAQATGQATRPDGET